MTHRGVNAGQLTNWWTQTSLSQNCQPVYGPGAAPGDSAVTWTCAGTYDPATPPAPAFAWDAVGNPVRPDAQVTPSSGNRLEWANGLYHSYDADGNLMRRFKPDVGALQYLSWNALGQLTGVHSYPDPANGNRTDSVTFGYDAWGRRVRKTDVTTGVTTYFVWDGADLAADVDGGGNTAAMYAYFPGGMDQPLSVQLPDAGRPYYYVTEPPGHVTGLVDFTGAVLATYRYDPFGGTGVPGGSGTGAWTNRLLFGAREYDAETGLYYHRARYYDPQLGRFLSPDPSGLAGGINQYAYAGNDPVNYRDPTGLDKYCSWAASGSGQQYSDVVGGQNYTVTVGAPQTWGCQETPDFNFDPADEYYGNGFVYGSPGGGGGGGGGGRSAAAPANHYVGGGPAALIGAGRLLAPAEPVLQGFAAVELAFMGGGAFAARSGLAVIGNFPRYLEIGRALGANRFTVGDAFYRIAGPGIVTPLNVAFMRANILLGNSFLVALRGDAYLSSVNRIGPGLQMELDLLASAGYRQMGRWFVP